jgi:RsiW-degrading membrane proteinase PrsW (M82 family)
MPKPSLVAHVALVALLGLAFGLLGCSPHLVGTNDAALEYTLEPSPVVPGKAAEAGHEAPAAGLVAAAVKERLSAAQVTADVSETPGGVRVVVDADAVNALDALVSWRGGIGVYRMDAALAPAPASSSPPMPDASHAALSERTARGDWQTVFALAPPVVTLGLGDAAITGIASAQHGRALAVSIAPAAQDLLAAEKTQHPGETLALTRDHTVMASLSIEELVPAAPATLGTSIEIPFGGDVAAFTRAAHARALLETPILPVLRRSAVARLPPDVPLAVACAVLPFLLSLGWLFFVQRFDRSRPEPAWLVLATFALGGLAVVPAGLVEAGCAVATPLLDPSVMTLGGQVWALPIAVAVFSLVVGVAEEGAKFLGAWSLARHRPEFDEPVDGIIYGCAAALGFAAVENVKYFAIGRMSGTLVALRAFITVPAHLFFGAIWGYAMGRELVSRRTNALEYLALAALAHGAFDAVLSIDGLQFLGTAIVLALGCVFVALMRSALRFGVVPLARARAGVPPPSEVQPASDLARTYFRVGSRGAFYACAAGIVLSAFALMTLGSAYEILHHRIGVVFVSLATVMLVAFGLAAYGASATIPLDVAIDLRGVTLAGSETLWSAVTGMTVERRGRRATVVLQTLTGALRLGPAAAAEAETIAGAVRAMRT